MRVVEIISGLGLGGAEKSLAKRLEFAPPDVETHVIVTGGEDSALSTPIGRRASLHRNVSRVAPLVHALQADLILTHNPREALRVLSHPTLPNRYPVAVIAHNEITSEYRSKAKALDAVLPIINSRARMHLAVSTGAAQGPQCMGSRDVRVNLLGSTFDTSCEPDQRYWPPQTKHRVLVLGRFSPQKNLLSLIQAVGHVQSLLRQSLTHLVIAGDGPLKGMVLEEARRTGVEDLVTFPGWVTPVDNLLAGAETLLITSSNEGGPLVLFEALLAGIRVVSTPVGAAGDVLVDDPHLRILPTATPQALANGLEQVVHDPPLVHKEVEKRRFRYQWLDSKARASAFYDLCRQASS